jgi:transposase-like protein
MIAGQGTRLSVREAATELGVAESTLRRVIKQATADGGSPTHAECEYRGRFFRATRKADRQPWQVVFDNEEPLIDDVSHAAVARVDGRIAELRVAMLPVSQEPALEHTPERRWWKFWG